MRRARKSADQCASTTTKSVRKGTWRKKAIIEESTAAQMSWRLLRMAASLPAAGSFAVFGPSFRNEFPAKSAPPRSVDGLRAAIGPASVFGRACAVWHRSVEHGRMMLTGCGPKQGNR